MATNRQTNCPAGERNRMESVMKGMRCRIKRSNDRLGFIYIYYGIDERAEEIGKEKIGVWYAIRVASQEVILPDDR